LYLSHDHRAISASKMAAAYLGQLRISFLVNAVEMNIKLVSLIKTSHIFSY
jgi:hypothetical protein